MVKNAETKYRKGYEFENGANKDKPQIHRNVGNLFKKIYVLNIDNQMTVYFCLFLFFTIFFEFCKMLAFR